MRTGMADAGGGSAANSPVVGRLSIVLTRVAARSHGRRGGGNKQALRAARGQLTAMTQQGFAWRKQTHPFVQQSMPQLDQRNVSCRASAGGALQAIVSDHVVQGRVIFPGAGYLELARAASALLEASGTVVRSAFFLQPMLVKTDGLQVDCMIADGSSFEVLSGGVDHGCDPTVDDCGSSALRMIARLRSRRSRATT